MPSPARLRTIALYLVVVGVWGTTWIAIKASVASIPPLTASGLRFAIAFPLLALIVARTKGATLRYPRGKGKLLALVALAYFVFPYALMNLGGEAIPSGLAAVLFATVSIFILALSVPVLGTRISRRQAAAVGVALAALTALIVNQTGLGGGADPLGVLAVLTAAALHATVYVLIKRDGGAISPLTINALPMGLAGLLLCTAGIAFEHPDPSAITGESLGALLYLGTIASVAGFLAYFQLLRRLGPVPLSLVFVLFPLVAQVAAVAGGERPMAGASLALLGLVLVASLVALTGRRDPRPLTTPTLPKEKVPMSPATEPYPRRWKALGVLALSLLVITMGNTILNVGLPTIREELDASSSQLQWIVDSYLLVFAGFLLAAGSLGDRFGRRRALLAGLVTFGLGSILAAISDTATTLIASRALMGLGAAGIMPTTLSILTNIFPARERPKAIAAWAAVSGLGIAIGPISGGFLIEHFAWSSIFLINIPIVIACLAGALALVPESRDPESPRIDVAGTLLSIAGLSAIVWGLIEAPERGWGEPLILSAFTAGAATIAAFIAWERRTDHPMLDVRVFRNLRFSAASISITFVFFALMGVMYFLTTYLQSVLGFSALEAGLRMLPIAAGMIVASKLSVAMTRRLGTKITVATGLAHVAGSMLLIAGFDTGTGDIQIAMALGTMGQGIGLAMSPATDAIMSSLPRAKAGIGSAMNDVVREVGGTLGIAVLGSLLTSSYGNGMQDAATGLPAPAAEAVSDSVGGAHEVAAQIGGGAGAKLIAAADGAFVDAMATTAGIAAGAAVIGALIALAFLPSRDRGETPEPLTAWLQQAAA
jgi:EmrB/QacA subfamily drug resistance transporter